MMTRAERRDLTRRWVLRERPSVRFLTWRQVQRCYPGYARVFRGCIAEHRLMLADALFYEDREAVYMSVVGEGQPPESMRDFDDAPARGAGAGSGNRA